MLLGMSSTVLRGAFGIKSGDEDVQDSGDREAGVEFQVLIQSLQASELEEEPHQCVTARCGFQACVEGATKRVSAV